jgi:hypothetical protein
MRSPQVSKTQRTDRCAQVQREMAFTKAPGI